MPATLSTEKAEETPEARRARIVKIINLSVFQSVCQHVITLQSEPMLVREICKGNVAESARLLANTQGLVGILGLFLNQAGGKLSDAIGRKPGLLLGPLGNIIIGQLVYHNPTSRFWVLLCRVMRMVITTFSNTVICSAALTDVCSGKDLAIAMSAVGATTGLAVILTPILETLILQRTKNPRFSYLALSGLALVQFVYNLLMVPETMDPAKMISIKQAFSFNPFGFCKLYTKGSKALRKMATITTLQMCLEGKNLSDIVEIWKREHLKWDIAGSRNFVVVYGALCVAAGVSATPYMLKTLSPRAFTSITNWLNFVGFMLRGATELPWVFLLATVPMLPGVNGASASALKALSSDLATAEGFGKGEFSAWINNLRALAGSMAPVMYGNFYAWARRRGVYPGAVFWLAALIGALLPEMILWNTRNDELQRGLEKSPETSPEKSKAGSNR